MQREPVQSSHIASIGFEDGVLEVEFKSGAVWQYPGVMPHEMAELSKASSKGTVFHAIKQAHLGVRVS